MSKHISFLKSSKNNQLSVYQYDGSLNQREAKKNINHFRRTLIKQNPNAKMCISMKIRNNEVQQEKRYDEQNFFWNSTKMQPVEHEIELASQYGARIEEISIMVLNY